ncbi:MAG: hypothetical protein J0M17_25580 [Planctomycetes bacterium]|nr:hypothetical protein [Planctomycetota bacterium]
MPVGRTVWSLCLLTTAMLAVGTSRQIRADAEPIATLSATYSAQTAKYREALMALAERAAQGGLGAEAEQLRTWSPAPATDRGRFFLAGYSPPIDDSASSKLPADAQEVLREFATLRRARADEHFQLARRAAADKQFSQAVAWTYEALRENPDHADAGRVLGLQTVDGRQRSPFAQAKHRANQVWHAKFGWLPQEHVTRYESGERYLNGKWVTAEEDARIHATVDRGWAVDTENFRVVTNHSLEEGVRLADRLERMHQVWRQLFARYHTAEAEWTRLFNGGAPRDYHKRRYNVVYFRTKEEYVAALEKREPKIGLTSGIFMSDDDRAYFFADAERSNDPFVFHEVAHQLFALSKPTALRIATRGNFWIVEGVACHFESLALHDDYAELGGTDNPRMKAARFRLLQDKFFVPLAEFAAMSRSAVQSNPRIATLYSQASGVASFLLEADDGKYREAAVDYLQTVYANKDTPTTFTQTTGRTFAELDAEYQRYIAELPAPSNGPN